MASSLLNITDVVDSAGDVNMQIVLPGPLVELSAVITDDAAFPVGIDLSGEALTLTCSYISVTLDESVEPPVPKEYYATKQADEMLIDEQAMSVALSLSPDNPAAYTPNNRGDPPVGYTAGGFTVDISTDRHGARSPYGSNEFIPAMLLGFEIKGVTSSQPLASFRHLLVLRAFPQPANR